MIYKVILFLITSFTSAASSKSQTINKDIIINRSEISNLIDSLPAFLSKENTKGNKEWKKRFNYIADISVNKITYKSDGLKVNGFLIVPKKI